MKTRTPGRSITLSYGYGVILRTIPAIRGTCSRCGALDTSFWPNRKRTERRSDAARLPHLVMRSVGPDLQHEPEVIPSPVVIGFVYPDALGEQTHNEGDRRDNAVPQA